METRCAGCDRDVSAGTAAFAGRRRMIRAAQDDAAYLCAECASVAGDDRDGPPDARLDAVKNFGLGGVGGRTGAV